MTGYHEDPSVIQLHRVIGAYITIFSELIATMRRQMYSFLAEPAEFPSMEEDRLIGILFANMTARPMTDAFFAMCVEAVELNEADLAIKKTLQSWTQRHIASRNDIAHADWNVGWVVHDTNEPVPPSARKTRMSGGRLVSEQLPLGASNIVALINDLNSLHWFVRDFGYACDSLRTDKPRHPSDTLEVHEGMYDGITAKRVRRRADAVS